VNRLRGIAAAALLFALGTQTAHSQELLGEKLYADRVGGIEPGTYVAGDDLRFTLDPYGDAYLLRIGDDPEVYVLRNDRASLGGRLLKYDSGATALQVTGWGALTLYTDQQPDGLPAMRDGDSEPPELPQLSIQDMQSAAGDETRHLLYADRIAVNIAADWMALTVNPNARAIVFDAMQNTARGLDRFASREDARGAMAQRVSAVRLVLARWPSIRLWGRVLVITVDPSRGYAGRLSSRAIAQSLPHLLAMRRLAGE
jgi:hypothetical protein